MIRLALAAPLALALAIATPALAVEVRTCGDLRTAPLSDERNVQSALLQAFTVVNTEAEPVILMDVRFQLKTGGEVTDTRQLLATDVDRAAKQGPMVEALAQQLPSQLCNGTMLKGTSPARTATLAPGEAITFLYQPFVWRGGRDGLDIVAVTEKRGVSSETRAAVRIEATAASTPALFPLAGRSYVAVAASFHTPHRWARVEEFALDILAIGTGGGTHKGTGTRMTDYYAFGRPVRAVADGKVVRATFDAPDNMAMLKRPGETGEDYLARLIAGQSELIGRGIEAVLGNHVVIDHGNGEFSVYAHLKQGNTRVAEGQQIKAGQTIGALGSSGNSTEPHLHYQLCDNPDMNRCRSLPVSFQGVELPLELAPRSLQSGDVVETVH